MGWISSLFRRGSATETNALSKVPGEPSAVAGGPRFFGNSIAQEASLTVDDLYQRLSGYQQFLDIRSDWDAAKQSKFRSQITGYLPLGSGADWHYRVQSDFWRIMEWARYFRRNSPIISPAIARVCRHVVRKDYQLVMDTGDKEFDKRVQDDFHHWSTTATNCDVRGRQNLTEMFSQSVDSALTDGDLFLTPVIGADNSLRLQYMEGHRCRGAVMPGDVHGVILGDYGKPKRFTFTREDVGFYPQVNQTDLVSVEAYGAFGRADEPMVAHLYFPQRFTQNRGVSCFAPCFDLIGMHDDLEFNVLVKSQLQNTRALIRERAASIQAPPNKGPIGTRATDYLPDGQSRPLDKAMPGMEYAGHPGEKLIMSEANTPNEQFFPHMELILTFIAMNCHLPLQALLFDPKKNFSAWRGAQEEAKAGFIGIQQWLINHEAKQIVRWFLLAQQLKDKQYLAAEQRLGPNYFHHHWQAPAWPYIEPNKDASADDLQARTGLSSRRRLAANRGVKYADEIVHATEDIGVAIRAAMEEADEINGEFPNADPPVSWLMTCAINLQGVKPPVPTLAMGEEVLKQTQAADPPADDDANEGDE
jgi:capsid protein